MVRLPWNKKQTYRLNAKPQMGSSRLDIGQDSDLDLEFSRSFMEFATSQPKNGPIGMKQKANISNENLGLKWDYKFWPRPWPWPLIFKVKYGICYISAKNGLIVTKQKANIDWTLSLKLDHQVWHWPWPWPLIFKVEYGICYISAKNGPIGTKQKANISSENLSLKWDYKFWLWPWPWPLIFKVKYGICYISARNGLIATKRKANKSIELLASNVTMTLKGEVWGSNR